MTLMRTQVIGTLILGACALAACSDERAITTEPIGDVGYGQNLLKAATNLPRGRAIFPTAPAASATPATDSIFVDLAGIDSLTTGSYVVWVGNDSATKFARATGTLTVSKIDTTINNQGDPVFTPSTATIPNVSSFRNGGQNTTYRFATTRANVAGLAASDSANLILVSIEAGAPGATPSNKRILWARRSQATSSGTPAVLTTGLRFGNYAPRIDDEYVFASTARTTAAFGPGIFNATTLIVPRGRVEVRGPIFTVNDSNYYRPPIGYYYEAFAIRTDTLGRFVDTVSLGVKASPYPNRISFFTADTENPDPTAFYGSPTPVIVASQHRVSADSIPEATVVDGRPWAGFAFVYVTLQNKAAPMDRMGAVAIMTTGLPSSILGR